MSALNCVYSVFLLLSINVKEIHKGMNMTQNSEHTSEYINILDDVQLTDEELELLSAEVESEVREKAKLKEQMDDEIFVILNEFAEATNNTIDMFHSASGVKTKTNGGYKFDFISVIESELENNKDPFAHDFFLIPCAMTFTAEEKNANQSVRYKTIGGERLMLLNLRVSPLTNNVIVKFLSEPSESIKYAEVELDFTKPSVTQRFANFNYDVVTNGTRAKRATLEFLMRFFTDPDDNLDSEDYEEIIKNNDLDMATGINPVVEVIVKVQKVLDKYRDIENRTKFNKLYANQGIEQW